MWNLAQRAKFPCIHRQEVCSLRGAATIGKHSDSAIGALEGDTFESDFNFVMLDLNVLDFSSQAVNQCSVGREVNDAEVRLSTFSIEKGKRIRHAFFNRKRPSVIPDTGKTGGVGRAVHSPEVI